MSSSHSSIKNALTLQACFLLASIVSGIGTGFAEAQDREERNPLALQAPLFKYAELKDLDLMNLDGAPISWKDSSRLRVYAFLGCDCPVAKLYGRRIEELQARYSNPSNPGDSIEWVGVMSSPQDTVEDIRHFARELHLEFPFVRDADQAIASRLRVSRTAEVILVNRKNEVIYRGRIDDQYAPGVTKSKVAREDLANAIDAALRGETPEIAITEPVGCRISFDRKPASTEASNPMAAMFADSIVPIFNKHCTECHRPGEIGPFDITDRSEIQGWSEMILEVLDNGRMPPWHADPNHGSFKNARAISREEIETVRQWVRAGAPLGELAHLGSTETLPKENNSNGWRLAREPDLVVPMSQNPYSIPATGTVEYQYFVVDPKITEDRWVSAAQVIPGDASVVHHAIVFIRPPDNAEFLGIGWLTAYVPGQMATRFPEGYARKVPAGSKFVFQMHYTPNGRATNDLSKIGLTFVDDSAVTNEVFTVVGIDQDFEIPPGASNHAVSARVPRFPKDGELLAVSPHMHVRGRSFELRASRGSDSEILLRVPRYDFNWQHTYEWSDRIPLADIDALDFTVTFDNSDGNPTNPDAKEYVMWGDQTWEEMAVAFFEVSRPRNKGAAAQGQSISDRSDAGRSDTKREAVAAESQTNPMQSPNSSAVKYAEEYLAKWDTNKDGVVSFEEAPRVLRDFGFSRIDRNNDRKITREELIEAGQRRVGQ